MNSSALVEVLRNQRPESMHQTGRLVVPERGKALGTNLHRWTQGLVVRLACLILLGLAYGASQKCLAIPPPGDSSTNNVPIDLNRDGFNDFHLRVYYQRISAFEYVASYACHLVPLGRSACLGERPTQGDQLRAQPLEVGTIIPTQPDAGCAWGGSLWLRSETYFDDGKEPTHSISGVISSNRETAYLGIRFQAADGPHLGWVLVKAGTNQVLLADYGFHPQPNTPIAAGEKPTSTNENPAILTSVDLDGDNGIDFAVAQRRWTNTVTGESYLEAKLLGAGTNAALCAKAEPGWPTGVYPLALTNQTMVPRNPAAPSSWVSLDQAPALLLGANETDISTASSFGPLAGRSNVFVGVRLDSRYGWLEFRADGRIKSYGFMPTGSIAVGEPSPPLGRQSRIAAPDRIDFNHDGLIDAVFRAEGGQGGASWTLYLLGETTLLTTNRDGWSVIPHVMGAGEVLSDPTAKPQLVWSARKPVQQLWGYTVSYYDDPNYGSTPYWGPASTLEYQPSPLLGLRFRAGDGQHLGWLRFKIDNPGCGMPPYGGPWTPDYVCAKVQLDDYGYEPAPGSPLAAGTKSSIQPPLLSISQVGSNYLQLSWNESMEDYVLEGCGSLPSGRWFHSGIWETVGVNRVRVLMSSKTGLFFRLRKQP